MPYASPAFVANPNRWNYSFYVNGEPLRLEYSNAPALEWEAVRRILMADIAQLCERKWGKGRLVHLEGNNLQWLT